MEKMCIRDRYMAGELALKFGNGLRVNAIAPGFFLTEQKDVYKRQYFLLDME